MRFSRSNDPFLPLLNHLEASLQEVRRLAAPLTEVRQVSKVWSFDQLAHSTQYSTRGARAQYDKCMASTAKLGALTNTLAVYVAVGQRGCSAIHTVVVPHGSSPRRIRFPQRSPITQHPPTSPCRGALSCPSLTPHKSPRVARSRSQVKHLMLHALGGTRTSVICVHLASATQLS